MNEIKVHFNPERDGNLKERAEAAAKSAKVSLSAWCRRAIGHMNDMQLDAERKRAARKGGPR